MAFHSVFLVFLAGLAFFSKAAPPGSADSKHPVFIKILDSVRGSPAPNVPVKLYKEAADGSWELLNSKIKYVQKKIRRLDYKAVVCDYQSQVVFTANHVGYRHYSIVVLLSPFSYSTTVVVSEPVE